MAALAHVVEAQAEGGAETQQPLEVGGGEAEPAAVDRALRPHEVGVDVFVGGQEPP